MANDKSSGLKQPKELGQPSKKEKEERRERCSNLSTLTDDLCFFETQNSF